MCLAPDLTSKNCSVATPGQKGGETARSLELFGSGFESWSCTCLLCALVGKIMAAGLSFPSSALSQQCAPRPHRVGSEEATGSCGRGLHPESVFFWFRKAPPWLPGILDSVDLLIQDQQLSLARVTLWSACLGLDRLEALPLLEPPTYLHRVLGRPLGLNLGFPRALQGYIFLSGQ